MSRLPPLTETLRWLAASPLSRRRQLDMLRGLDDRRLADLGICRGEALRGRPAPDRETLMPDRHDITLPAPVTIRDAAMADMAAVQAIYAHHVLHGFASFEETPPDAAELVARWVATLGQGLPYLAAEIDGRVVGYAYAGAHRPRPAYRHTVEDSVYVADGLAGRGIGRALLAGLIARCEAGPWRQMVAVIGDSRNTASIALHERMGFHRAGSFRSIGFKLGRWVDTVMMQRTLGAGDTVAPGPDA
ncbi:MULTISPECIES: GNAT family N-acetyltransferase [unclassified Inquilinus]|uniref:GNAT family N-acetyltransferase n=1 Tax=unclassified Inquilinus TaxID=2645927 RepID=UPI003F939138